MQPPWNINHKSWTKYKNILRSEIICHNTEILFWLMQFEVYLEWLFS